ncbi:hypothetical protein [uncultured Winogradskyella sp.]|uniref:hypothetical protein n=1 Tax=uncultured Winogradskyella sp. TaxID=395353 RepID=UPI00261682C0|nr:hypothetical protein [uncultured Winogradskyella sp.]
MRYLIGLLFFLTTAISIAQQEFHVFPLDGETTKGTSKGDGSPQNPWDLQTALSQSSDKVNGGDIIWIHNGIYTGHFKSLLHSTISNKYITVSAYKNDRVILNGNTDGNEYYTLEVNGNNVIYKNFEITYLGDFSRLKSDENFKLGTGIHHVKGTNCKFQNLIIHNIPGTAFGSWKATGGTVIEDCIIYNNGYQATRGHGVGMYVQNKSDDIRLIRNNIIFNNYYKGIEVWSASSGHKFEFVKNINIVDNIFFNNGNPSGIPRDNVIIATDDSEGTNIAKNIKVKRNVFYHNIDFKDLKNYGFGTGLAIGYNRKALVENIEISDNIILGRNNPLNIMHVKSLEFKNNLVYGGYVNLSKSSLPALKSGLLNLENNLYHTRKAATFRIIKGKKYNLNVWQKTFNVDRNSQSKVYKDFEINPVLKVQKLITNPNHFNIALLEKSGNDVTVDFGEFDIEEGAIFKIYDIENRKVVVNSGKVSSDLKIKFPMGLQQFELPLHNTIATKSVDNFGVYRIEFENKKRRKNFFGRFFDWLF